MDVELDIVVRQDLRARHHFNKGEHLDAIRIWQGALRHLEDIGGDGASYECKAIEMTARMGIAHLTEACQEDVQDLGNYYQRQQHLLDTMHNIRKIITRDASNTTDGFSLQVVSQILRPNTIGSRVKGQVIRQCCAEALQELFYCAADQAKAHETKEHERPDYYTGHFFKFYTEALLIVGAIRSRDRNFLVHDSESSIQLFAGLAGCYLQFRNHQQYRALISEVRANSSDAQYANLVELQVVRNALDYGSLFRERESTDPSPMLTYIMGVVVRLSRNGSVRDLDLERLVIEHLFWDRHYQPVITLIGQLEWEKTKYASRTGLYLGAAYLNEGNTAEAKRALRGTITISRKNRSDLSDFYSHLAFLSDVYNLSGEPEIAAGYKQEITEEFWLFPSSFDMKTTYHRLVELGYNLPAVQPGMGQGFVISNSAPE